MELKSRSWLNGDCIPTRFAAGRLGDDGGVGFSDNLNPHLAWSDLPEEQTAWLEFMVMDESAPPDTAPASARELLDALLSQLPPDDRLVISLLDLEEKSVKEIARLTGWNVTLIKVRAFRARRKLRKLAEAFKNENPHERL